MCRWLAYTGPPLRIDSLLTRPDHSLIDQSIRARQSIHTTNGDGFGVGWYGDDPPPGVFRDTHPAWNNANLQQLAAHVRSPLFMAHVRAATGTAVQETNCHPFRFENWLFQHNGYVPEFHSVKRSLVLDVAPEFFSAMEGSTDSEILFYLALSFGLQDDPLTALQRMVGRVEEARDTNKIEEPFYCTAVASDGQRVIAERYSSNRQSRTLYYSQHYKALSNVHDTYELLPDGGVVVVSEPLDGLAEHWKEVPESTSVVVEEGKVIEQAFAPWRL